MAAVALHQFLTEHRDEIVALCERKLLSMYPDKPSEELLDQIPNFLDEIIKAQRREVGLPEYTPLPRHSEHARHLGHQRFARGYPISQLALDLGVVSDSVGDIATEYQIQFDGRAYKLMDECIDTAIAQAIDEYSTLERASGEEHIAEWIGSLGHELRNSIHSAQIAFEVLQSGRVGIDSKTAKILERSLGRLATLVDTTLAAARLRATTDLAIERHMLRTLVQEVADAAEQQRSIAIEIDVDPEITVDVDRSLFDSALSNLIQNALKFTRTEGTIHVWGQSDAEAVMLVIEDECGGLGERDPELLFTPFRQGERGKARGVGLGLAISRKAIEAHGGKLSLRDAAPRGCVFTIWLPRSDVNQGGAGSVK